MVLANCKRKFDSISSGASSQNPATFTATTLGIAFSTVPIAVATSNSNPTTRVGSSTSGRKRKRTKKITDAIATDHTAATYKTPQNAQATLEGLPAELRLQIYDYLCDSTIIHVHHHDHHADGSTRFTWTPCRSPSPKSPLLCANPKWSGLCNEKDRCTHKVYAPAEPRGFWALAASAKAIRSEAKEFFLRRTVVSISAIHLELWLDYLAKHAPRQIDQLRRITLAGPNTWAAFSSHTTQILRDRVSNLEGVGFQCQDSIYRWFSYFRPAIELDRAAWKKTNIYHWILGFDPSVEIAAEVLVWRKPGLSWTVNTVEQQIAIRVLRRARAPDDGESGVWKGPLVRDEDIEVEVDNPGQLVECKRNAKWRQWWRGKETRGWA